jgi:biopolymer transport protein ExbD
LINSDAELERRFSELAAQSEDQEIHVSSSGKAKYEVAIKVMASAQRHQIKKIGIVGTHEFVN